MEVLPDLTTPAYVDIEVTVEDLETQVARASLVEGFELSGPGGELFAVRNPTITPANNANVSVVTTTADARNLPNGGPWVLRAKASVANLSGLAIGAAQSLATFNINIPNNPTPSFDEVYDFRSGINSLPSGFVSSNSAVSFDNRGMRIVPSGTADWGTRCVIYTIDYADGGAVEVDFTAPSSLAAIGLGRRKAVGGWGDFDGDDSLVWWPSEGTGDINFGNTTDSANGSGEWVQGTNYRLRLVRSGLNTNIAYFKDVGQGFGNAFKVGQVVTPTAVNNVTQIMMDAAYSSELFIQRVAVKNP